MNLQYRVYCQVPITNLLFKNKIQHINDYG